MGLYLGRPLLVEGSRDKALAIYLPQFEQLGIPMNLSSLKQLLLKKFVNEAGIHRLSESSNYYLAGAARYYFNGDLTANKNLGIFNEGVQDVFISDVCKKLDAVIGILRNAYIDSVGTKFEQPEDFGTLSINQLFRKYGKKINAELGLDKKEEEPSEEEKPTVSNDYSVGDYTYEILYSYDDAKKYREYTEPGAWCITYGKQHYDGYIRSLKGIHYVVFRKNGFENIPRKMGAGFTKRKPHDEYGNSLICVLQSNKNGEPIYITSRWNHGSYADGTQGTSADHAYTKEEFLNVIGDNGSVLERAFEQWKANSGEEVQKKANRKELYASRLSALRTFKMLQMRINNGANPNDMLFGEGNNIKSRLISKGLYSLCVSGGDNVNYATVFDEKTKKIYFDSYLANVGDNSDAYIMYDNSYYVRYINDFLIPLKVDKSGYRFYVYNIIKHGFIGEEKPYNFVSISCVNFDINECPYIGLQASQNQISIFDVSKMDFVRAKGGSPWFENITELHTNFSNYQNTMPSFSQRSIFILTYDSSSGEKYLLNIAKKELKKIEENYSDDGFALSTYQNIGREPKDALHNYLQYRTRNGVRIRNFETDEWFSINGISEFTEISSVGCLVSFRTIENPNVTYYYDLSTNDYLRINGEIVTNTRGNGLVRSYYHEDYVVFILLKSDVYYAWEKTIIYDLVRHEVYHDNINGYVFKVYGDRGEGIVAYYPNSNEKYTIKVPLSDNEQTNESVNRKTIYITEQGLLSLKNKRLL